MTNNSTVATIRQNKYTQIKVISATHDSNTKKAGTTCEKPMKIFQYNRISLSLSRCSVHLLFFLCRCWWISKRRWRSRREKNVTCAWYVYRNVCLARWTRAHMYAYSWNSCMKRSYLTFLCIRALNVSSFFRVVVYFLSFIFLSCSFLLLISMCFNKVALRCSFVCAVRRITGFFLTVLFFIFLLFVLFYFILFLFLKFFECEIFLTVVVVRLYAHSLTVIHLLNNFYLPNICTHDRNRME